MLTAILSLILVTSAFAEVPPPGSVTIKDFSYMGSGCPAGSVSTNLSPDNEALTFLFDQFVVDSTQVRGTVARKDCKVRLQLEAPPGWAYALVCIHYRGFADLAAGAKAATFAKYKFGFSREKQLGQLDLTGPFSDDYTQINAIELNEAPWSRCGDRGGPDVVTIDTTAQVKIDPRVGGNIQHMASGNARLQEYPQPAPITNVTLVRQASAAPCVQNRSFGFNGNIAWVKLGCRGDFNIALQGQGAARGLLTIDAQDVDFGQDYKVAWRRCSSGGGIGGSTGGKWVQATGHQTCDQVCRGAGLRTAIDEFGAACASGEARPSQAAGINFSLGCWGSCAPEGNIATQTQGLFCYKQGQARDADRTDRIVGCYCNN